MMRLKLKIFSGLTFLMLGIAPCLSWALEPDDGFSLGHKIETHHFTVLIESGVDDEALIRALNIGPQDNFLSGQIMAESPYSPDNLGNQLDILFGWVCSVLDMKLYSYKGVIKIAHDENALKQLFHKLYGQPGFSDKSFFVQEINTIYVAAPDFTKEILGHEMGHAAMGSYFLVQPPEKVAEVLAGYVEYQLRKQSAQR